MSLQPAHGYVFSVAIASGLFMTYLGIKVAGQRKAAGVPYPYGMSSSLTITVYADKAEAETDPAKKVFNCYQRAHQNTLEGYPIFLTLLAIAAIDTPVVAAASGLIWIVGKYFYAQGYYTGVPANRTRGSFSYIGLFTLLGCAIKTSYDLISRA